MIGLGTIVNVSAVVGGSCLGLLFNGRFEKRFQDIIIQSLGFATIFIGVAGTLKCMFSIIGSSIETTGAMMMIVSLVLGSIIGELINIEKRMQNLGNWLKKKVKSKNDSTFVEGFVTASLVICIGAMAVVGSIQDGISGDASMLYAKSTLDFVIVLIFASTLGKGVLFSAIPLGIYEGLITLFAFIIAPALTEQMINNISFVGSILIFCVGVNLSFDKKIKVANMLPALIIAVIYSLLNL